MQYKRQLAIKVPILPTSSGLHNPLANPSLTPIFTELANKSRESNVLLD
jgi:hypothetical protein